MIESGKPITICSVDPLSSAEPKQSSPLGLIVGALAFAAGYFGMQAFSPETRFRIYVGAGMGLVIALIPFFVARKRQMPKLAAQSLLLGGITGAIGGALLALPAAAVMTFLAIRRGKSNSPPP